MKFLTFIPYLNVYEHIFLESLSNDIYVFCSSEKRSLNVGVNFVSSIFNELDSCDVLYKGLLKA